MTSCRCHEPVCICGQRSSSRRSSLSEDRSTFGAIVALTLCIFILFVILFVHLYHVDYYHHGSDRKSGDAPPQDNKCMGTCKPGCRPVYSTKSDGTCQLKCDCDKEGSEATKSTQKGPEEPAKSPAAEASTSKPARLKRGMNKPTQLSKTKQRKLSTRRTGRSLQLSKVTPTKPKRKTHHLNSKTNIRSIKLSSGHLSKWTARKKNSTKTSSTNTTNRGKNKRL